MYKISRPISENLHKASDQWWPPSVLGLHICRPQNLCIVSFDDWVVSVHGYLLWDEIDEVGMGILDQARMAYLDFLGQIAHIFEWRGGIIYILAFWPYFPIMPWDCWVSTSDHGISLKRAAIRVSRRILLPVLLLALIIPEQQDLRCRWRHTREHVGIVLVTKSHRDFEVWDAKYLRHVEPAKDVILWEYLWSLSWFSIVR